MKTRKHVFFIVVLVTAALLYLAFYGLRIGSFELKGADSMRFGIDIRGGVEATYTPKDLERRPSPEELEAAKAIIETRMDAENISDREVTVDEQNGSVIVRFPWKSGETDFDPQQAISELGETALLTFRDPKGKVVLEGRDVKKSYAALDEYSASYIVILELNSEGSEKFAEATGKLTGQRISIYMDENEISAPLVKNKITGGVASIDGQRSLEEAKDLASKINSGSLPFSMIAHDTNIISPTLGTDALNVMILAGEIAFALVCLFMLAYYRLPGFVACIALVLQVVGQLLALSIPQFTLTLPGIAGVILSIGMGVDANVIVSERIKEELNSGKTLRSAIDSGFKNAFSSVFDGNITVIIVSVVLISLGSGSILSFGYTLLSGVIMNFVAGVTASRLMIRSLSEFRPLQNPVLYGARRDGEEKPAKTIDFFRRKTIYFALSIAIALSGLAFTVINGIQLDIQFQGGTILKYAYTGELNITEAEERIEAAIGRVTNCQEQSTFGAEEKILIISLANNEALTSQEQELITDVLLESYPEADLSLSTTLTVQPFTGARFFRNGILAILLSFALILVYVGFRFRKIGGFSAGFMAIVALFHDAFVVTAVFIIFKIPLNDSFIAAVLTIIGFSINDTIVIYDRIRENKVLMGSKVTTAELVNTSIRQSMSRSINTNIAVFVSITIVYIFAQIYNIESIKDFALPMMFGTISGCYSTICIAGPLWTMWKNRQERLKRA